MKYLITESQYNKIKFRRRVGVFPVTYVMELLDGKDRCRDSFEKFLNYLIEDSLFSWMSSEDMDYISDLISVEMINEVKSYYEENCRE